MKPNDIVRLLRAIPEENLHAGFTGTIVHSYPEGSEAFEVEFAVFGWNDKEKGYGTEVKVVTVGKDNLERIVSACA